MSNSEIKIIENNNNELIIDNPNNTEPNSIDKNNCDTKKEFHGGNIILTAMFDHWFKPKM